MPHPQNSPYRHHWNFAPGVTYLNHGSFGPTPIVVQEALAEWTARLAANPMDFYIRRLPELLHAAATSLGNFVGTAPENLVFVDNATTAMNIVAASHYLRPDDEVLLTDHEYGAVMRIWRAKCKATGAKFVVRKLPHPLTSDEDIVNTLFAAATRKTRLLVVSHITSPTAVILPLEKICQRARELKIPVCVDGPHAIAHIPVDLDDLGCTYYCASLHKWLAAPLGSGFLYVTPNQQQHIKPALISWGRNMRDDAPSWKDEFDWLGTRNPAPFLAVPTALDLMTNTIGLETFRNYSRSLIAQARQSYRSLTGLDFDLAIDPPFDSKPTDYPPRYASMITLPLPPSINVPETYAGLHPLQTFLWEKHHIELPLPRWQDKLYLRISCHLYNNEADLTHLMTALAEYLSIHPS